MAGETATVQGAEAPAVTVPVAAAQQAVEYTVAELKAAAKKQFKCGPEVIDGAIYGKTKESYSIDEMKGLIEDFLKKPVKDGDE